MLIERPDSISLGMPAAKALQMATAAVRRCYMLPETMEHPVVSAECLQLAYLIQAYGLASHPSEGRATPKATVDRLAACQGDPPHFFNRPRRHVARDARPLELVILRQSD